MDLDRPLGRAVRAPDLAVDPEDREIAQRRDVVGACGQSDRPLCSTVAAPEFLAESAVRIEQDPALGQRKEAEGLLSSHNLHGPAPRAVRRPEGREHAVPRRGEEQPAAGGGQVGIPKRRAGARPRADIGHQDGSRGGAVGRPELGAAHAVVRGEVEAPLMDRQVLRRRAGRPRTDIAHPPGAGGRAVATPELQAVRRIGGGEIEGTVPLHAVSIGPPGVRRRKSVALDRQPVEVGDQERGRRSDSGGRGSELQGGQDDDGSEGGNAEHGAVLPEPYEPRVGFRPIMT